MLYFGRVGSLWGLCVKVDSSWGEKVITARVKLCRYDPIARKSMVEYFRECSYIQLFLKYYKTAIVLPKFRYVLYKSAVVMPE